MGILFTNPWFFTVGFFVLIILPGWVIGKILKFKFTDFAGRFLTYFGLGLSFYFVLNFLGIAGGFSLAALSGIIFVISAGLIIAGLVTSIIKKENFKLNWPKFEAKNIYLILLLALGILIIWWVDFKGPGLDGDPYFHLSIIRKAVDGSSLSSRALALTKTQDINPAYVFPVWNVLLAFLARTFSISIFSVWTNILFALTIVAIFCWYSLSKVIFEKVSWAVLATGIFLIFIIYAGPGFIFTRLGVPDTLCQMILLPLGLAFALKYIFDPSTELGASGDWKLLVLNLLLAFCLLATHGTHYFYLLLSLFVFGAIYAATHWRDEDYKETLSRILKVFLIDVAVVVGAGVIMEVQSRTISGALADFAKSGGGVSLKTTLAKFSLYYKYGYLLLPIALLFSRSKRRLFIVITMLIVPLVYWTPLKIFFGQMLSGIFINRLLVNTSYYFYVFALILGLILLTKDRVLAKFQKSYYPILAATVLIGIIIFFFEQKYQWISDLIYKIFYAKSTDVFITNLFWLILGIIIVIVAGVFIIFAKKLNILAESPEYKNPRLIFITMAIIFYVLVTPTIVNIRYQLNQPQKLTGEAYFLNLVKDQRALNFIRELPAKSVILTKSDTAKGLAALSDQYLAYNVGSAYDKKLTLVFEPTTADADKTGLIKDPKWAIDYIYLDNVATQGNYFVSLPENYQKVFDDGKTAIYRVNK